MANPAHVADIEAVLVARGYAEELFRSLAPFRHASDGFMNCTCPKCGKDRFWFSTTAPTCGCWHADCGYRGGWFTYSRDFLGLDWQQYAQMIAKAAGVDLDASPEQQQKYDAYVKRNRVIELAMEHFKAQLWAGSPELDYLRSRGYSDDEIRGIEAGSYRSPDLLCGLLSSRNVPEQYIQASGLLTRGLGASHTLILPWYDSSGRLIGNTTRTITAELEPKYIHSRGTDKKDGLIGMHRIRNQKRVLLVESGIGALLLGHHGIPAIAAAGLYVPAEAFLQLKRLGVESVVVALDNEEKARRAKRDLFKRLPPDLGLSLHMAELPDGVKAPDDLFKAQGLDAVRQLLSAPQSFATWLGRDLLTGINLLDSQEREGALRQCKVAYGEMKQRDGLWAADFMKSVLQQAGDTLDPEAVEARVRGRIGSLDEGEHLRSNIQTAAAGIAKVAERQQAMLDGRLPYRKVIPTGFAEIDDQIGGLSGALMVNVLGPEKSGKSRCSLALLARMAANGFGSGFISLDMGSDQFFSYLGSTLATMNQNNDPVTVRHLMQPENTQQGRDRLLSFATGLDAAAERIQVVSAGNRYDWRAICEYCRMMRDGGADIVAIDQAQRIIEYLNCKDQREYMAFANGVKVLSEELGIPVIILHQCNRNSHGKRPQRTDAYQTSAFSMLSDIIFLLYDKQSAFCNSLHDGFVRINDTTDEWMHDCRPPHKQTAKWQEPSDQSHEISTRPFNQRPVELDMQGRVPQERVRFGFDFAHGVFV